MLICAHGLPKAYCAVCTRTVQQRPGEFTNRPDQRERRSFGGGYSTNPRVTTFQIVKRIEPSTIEKSYDDALRRCASDSIQARFGKFRTPDRVDYAAIKRYLRG